MVGKEHNDKMLIIKRQHVTLKNVKHKFNKNRAVAKWQ